MRRIDLVSNLSFPFLYASLFVMSTEQPESVDFERTLMVRVTHWESLVSEKVRMTQDFTYFCLDVRGTFDLTSTFRLFTLPCDFKDIDERQPIDDEASYSKLFGIFVDLHAVRPLLYVWGGDSDSPLLKLPPVPGTKSGGGSSRLSSSVSGSSMASSARTSTKPRYIDNYTCVLCGFHGTGDRELFLEGCHVYEWEAHNRVDPSERDEKLRSLGLGRDGVDDPRNIINLCMGCHNRFTAHEVSIHEDLRWVVCQNIRGKQSASQTYFRDLHATPVPFINPLFNPPRPVLAERMSFFREKHATHHYCHLCSEIYGELSLLESHLLQCQAAVAPACVSIVPRNVCPACLR